MSALALVACGGGGDAQEEPAAAVVPPQISATDAHCGTLRAHDDGHTLYLTVAATCETAGSLDLRLSWREPDGTRRQQSLTVDGLGTEMAVSFDGAGVRTLSVHRRGTWRALENGDSWSWRDGAGLLAKDGGLYLLGGWNSERGVMNDVWFTRDLQRWTRLVEQAPWEPRHGAGWVVHEGRLWVIGGDLIDDAWSSADGMQWRREVFGAAFGKRYTPMVVSTGQRLLAYGGMRWDPYDWCAFRPECSAIGFGDVWSSTDGRQWRLEQHQAPWPGRGLVHGGLWFKGRLYVVGGGLKLAAPGAELSETVVEWADVWSSADGVSWQHEADFAGFQPRTHAAVLATEDGCYVAGGSIEYQPNTTHEVWFAGDCVNYAPLPGTHVMGSRHAASIAAFNGSIVLLGGHQDTAGTTVWQYFPDR